MAAGSGLRRVIANGDMELVGDNDLRRTMHKWLRLSGVTELAGAA
jgi:hypothetical protein